MKKAVIAGHVCLDITPVFPKKDGYEVSKVLVPGKIVRMDGVDVSTGGSVANTGLAMKLLGVDVRLLGKIGDDEFGRIIIESMKKYGYDGSKDMIISKDSGTSYSVVMAIPGIDSIFLHDAGANDTFCLEDLDVEAISEASLFHLGYPPHMKRMYMDDGEELVSIMKKVKSLGAATSLDMAAVDMESEAGRADWKKIIRKVLPYVDFFVPSVEELCFMLDKDRYQDWTARANGGDITEILDVERDIKPLADELFDMGAKVLLIKCGAPGLYYRTGDVKTLSGIGKKAGLDCVQWAEHEGFERSYKPEKILSGTGAGDTTIAAFLAAMLQEYPFEECIRLAAATGASCVASYDALSGLKTLRELESKIANGWEKL